MNMDELGQAAADYTLRFVEELLQDSLKAEGKNPKHFTAPLIGGRHQFKKIAQIRPRIWCAYVASTWWKLGGPRWAPELPIHCDDIAAARQDEHPWRGITGFFAGSLAAAGYNVCIHCEPGDYAASFMADERAPEHLRNHPELRRAFVPQPIVKLKTRYLIASTAGCVPIAPAATPEVLTLGLE